MRVRTILVACLLSFAWLPQAHAKSKPETPDKAAKKACAAGDFRKGVEILADLYVQTDDTTFIYNQGRCYEQNHQWVSAVDRFREYLRKTKNPTPDLNAEVERHITDCRLLQDEETKKSAPPPQPAPPLPVTAVSPTPPPPPQPTAPVAPGPDVTTRPAPTEAGSSLRTSGLIVGGIGLATLVTAVVLNLKANSLADEANASHDLAKESSQKSYKTGALLCYGVGGAALIAGTVVYLVGRAKGTAKSSSVALLPIWSPGEAGLAITGEF